MTRGTPIRWPSIDRREPQLALFVRARRRRGRGEYRALEFLEVEAKSIINEVPAASKVPFRYSINAYRGCSHACVYCFARPTHEYLGLDAGRDFETKIVVKVNAVERVRAETAPGRWAGERIAMGTNTDPYQPAEGKYRLTRGIAEVLTRRANPFSILTKSTLALRDLDVFQEAARRTRVWVDFSIGTLDEEVWRATEPGTPHPLRRVEAVARLNDAGIPSGVLLAPVIPGLSDRPDQIRETVAACVDAGARFVAPILLHLRSGVRQQYLGWLGGHDPDAAAETRRRYRGRAYAPEQVQQDLARLVETMVVEAGGNPEPRNRSRPDPEQEAVDPEPAQLGLDV